MPDRRQRIHELVLALLARAGELDLLEGEGIAGRLGAGPVGHDPAGMLERNRRLVQRYQALVRSAVTLDALIDQEVSDRGLGEGGLSGPA